MTFRLIRSLGRNSSWRGRIFLFLFLGLIPTSTVLIKPLASIWTSRILASQDFRFTTLLVIFDQDNEFTMTFPFVEGDQDFLEAVFPSGVELVGIELLPLHVFARLVLFTSKSGSQKGKYFV